MAAAGITRLPQISPPIRLQVRQVGRWMSKLARLKEKDGSSEIPANEEREMMTTCCWIPHTRTGIYFPQGQESVLDDIPNNSASLAQTYWLRSDDGVDKPHPDFPISHGVAYGQQ